MEKNIQENYPSVPLTDEWQKENYKLRAGRGSAYDKYSRYAHKGPYPMWGFSGGTPAWRVLHHPEESRYGYYGNQDYYAPEQEFISRQNEPYTGIPRFFDRFTEDSENFLHEVANNLNTDLETAFRITRAVLHAVRDRIEIVDAIHFGQTLPMMLKGIYFEQYYPENTPIVLRKKNAFLNFLASKDPKTHQDFPQPHDAIMGLRAVFSVLRRIQDPRQYMYFKSLLHSEIAELIDSPEYDYFHKRPLNY